MSLSQQISKTIQGFSGELFATADWKVNKFSGTKDSVSISMIAYVEGAEVEEYAFGFQPSSEEDSKNILAQAYEYAKTLPKFAGAVDN